MTGNAVETPAVVPYTRSRRVHTLARRLMIAAFIFVSGIVNLWVATGVLRHEISPYWFGLTSPLCFLGISIGFITLARAVSANNGVVEIGQRQIRQSRFYQLAPPMLARVLGIPMALAEELHWRMNPWISPSWPLAFWLLIGGGVGASLTSVLAHLELETAWIVVGFTTLALVALVVCRYRGEA